MPKEYVIPDAERRRQDQHGGDMEVVRVGWERGVQPQVATVLMHNVDGVHAGDEELYARHLREAEQRYAGAPDGIAEEAAHHAAEPAGALRLLDERTLSLGRLADEGHFVNLDRDACNALIKLLRRARDAAFGADA